MVWSTNWESNSIKSSCGGWPYGKKEFTGTWGCILSKQQEPPKYNTNSTRGIVSESAAADACCPVDYAKIYPPFIFRNVWSLTWLCFFSGDKCKQLYELETGNTISLPPKCLLEIKTKAGGQDLTFICSNRCTHLPSAVRMYQYYCGYSPNLETRTFCYKEKWAICSMFLENLWCHFL